MTPIRLLVPIVVDQARRAGIPLAIAFGLMLSAAAPGQTPAPSPAPETAPSPAGGVGSAAFPTTPFNDLTHRYRFVEHYPREDGRELPGSLGPYRVGLVETRREAIDQPQGSPRRSEVTRESVFVERATEQASLGGVIGSVRFVERFRTRPEDPKVQMGAQPLDGLTVALRYRSADWPFLQTTSERKPTDYEAEVLTRQMTVAQIHMVLPSKPIRLGDTWAIPRRGAQALLGEPGVRPEPALLGKFTELRREENGPRLVATFAVTGRVALLTGESAVNAEVQFTCQAEPPTASEGLGGAAANVGSEGLLEARGGVTEVRLARTSTGPINGPGRLRFQATHEVTMNRQLAIAEQAASLPKFPRPPKPDDHATWVVWVDPARRFQVEHPQDFSPPERSQLAPADEGTTALVRSRREGTDVIRIDHAPRTLTIEDLKVKLSAIYALRKTEVIRGEEGWLPDSDWPSRRVYRVESAVTVPAAGPPGAEPAGSRPTRIHFDGYLIQTSHQASFLVVVTSSREPIGPIRREIEDCLRTLEADPPIALLKPAPSAPTGPALPNP